MYICLYVFFFISHIPLLVVILHVFFHIYSYCTKFVNTYNYCFILRCFRFFNVASNFVKRKCVYKFNKVLIVFPYYLYVCIYVYMYVCMYVYMYVRMYVCM